MDSQPKIATGGRPPVEVVITAAAGGNPAHFTEILSVIRKVNRKNRPIGLSPLDQGADRWPDITKIHRDALTRQQRHRCLTQGDNPPGLLHLERILWAVDVDLNDIKRPFRPLILIGQAQIAGFDGGEGKHILPALPVAGMTERRPILAIQRGFKPVDVRRRPAPIHLNARQGGHPAQIDLQPCTDRGLAHPARGIAIIDRQGRFTRTGNDLPLRFGWNIHDRYPDDGTQIGRY